MNMLIMSIVGFFSGICASLGIGGGFVLLLYLTAIATIPQKEAQLINLMFFLPIAVISLILHLKNKLIALPALLPSIIGGVGGVFLGVFIATQISNDIISKCFAVFIFLIGIKEIFSKSKNKYKKDKARL